MDPENIAVINELSAIFHSIFFAFKQSEYLELFWRKASRKANLMRRSFWNLFDPRAVEFSLKITRTVPVRHENLSLPIPGCRTVLLICCIHGFSFNAKKKPHNRV
jgi:hypothetical protein